MKTKLILELFKHDCIKKGYFKLKNGKESPIYINLKNIISYPHILNMIVKLLYEKLHCIKFDHILGIPYGGLILANCLGIKYNIPSLLIRKEVKKYGLRNMIEGVYKQNDRCVIIEDTVTTGSSVIENIKKIKNKIDVTSILVVCDRRENTFGDNKLYDYNIDSIFTIKDVIETLYITSNIDNFFYYELYDYFKLDTGKKNIKRTSDLSMNEDFVKIIHKKKTNLSLIVDVRCIDTIFKIIELYGSLIFSIKIYSDLLPDFDDDKINKLNDYKKKYEIYIEEGKLFSKNDNVFFQEFTNNKKIFKWVDIITLSENHSKAIFNIVSMINEKHNKKIMISLDNFNDYEKTNYLIHNNKDIVSIQVDNSYLENCSYFNNIPKFRTYNNYNLVGKYIYYLKKEKYYINSVFLSINNLKENIYNLWI